MSVRIPLIADGPLTEATFIARPNPLIVEAEVQHRVVRAHMADRGRLQGLLEPGARLLLAPRNEIGRKTTFSVIGVYQGTELVSLNTQLPNRLIAAALAANALPQFARYPRFQPEYSIGGQRFDFRLGEGPASCILEVKSVGVIEGGIALFPDAPTERGRRQVEMLGTMASNGQRTALIFVIQRHRAEAFVPDDRIDPQFARALRRAIVSGVEVYAYCCPLSPEGLTLGAAVPVFGSRDGLPIALPI